MSRKLGTTALMYLMKNTHGDTTRVLQSGSSKEEYAYNAFGEQISSSGTADNPYRYCGEYVDNETGLIYLRNRYYDPRIGRFFSEDPAKSGLNWYVYCDNNPITRIDIGGLEWGYIRDFANDLSEIYPGSPSYTATGYGSVKVKVGGGYFQKTGLFYYNGNVRMPKHRGNSYDIKPVARNNDGKLYIRTDFYEAMGVNYGVYEQQAVVTTSGNRAKAISVGAVFAVAGSAVSGPAAVSVGLVGTVAGAYLPMKTPGIYNVKYIVAESYNPETQLYQAFVTTEYWMVRDEAGNLVSKSGPDYVYNKNWGSFTQSVIQ